jgi:thiamine-phosphate pyrophosphorylase
MVAAVNPRERLATARLYLVCDARPRDWLAAALRGGVDLIQLRDSSLDDAGVVAAARAFREAADEAGALFILNDRPDLVEACRADGVHVGQDDSPPAIARGAVGPERIVGRSTHAPEQAEAAEADPDVDYVVAGPVHATPTKPGRPPTGWHYLDHVARAVTKPWFAIGGLDATNAREALAHGARRIVVVRAIAAADDPEAAARELRTILEEAPVGAARP